MYIRSRRLLVPSSGSHMPLPIASSSLAAVSCMAWGLASSNHSAVPSSKRNLSAMDWYIHGSMESEVASQAKTYSAMLDISWAPLKPWRFRPSSHFGLLTLLLNTNLPSSSTVRDRRFSGSAEHPMTDIGISPLTERTAALNPPRSV